MSAEAERASLRASDADRERAVARLRDHGAAGRLEPEELEERVGSALSARTAGELSALLADLPRGGRPRRRDRSRRALGDHVRTFVVVQTLLIAIWALSGFGYSWVVWPLLGWGIGLVAHAGCARRRGGGSGTGRLAPTVR